jgi:hypothetical protein
MAVQLRSRKFSAQAEPPTVEVGAAASAEELTYWVRDSGQGSGMAYAGKFTWSVPHAAA